MKIRLQHLKCSWNMRLLMCANFYWLSHACSKDEVSVYQGVQLVLQPTCNREVRLYICFALSMNLENYVINSICVHGYRVIISIAIIPNIRLELSSLKSNIMVSVWRGIAVSTICACLCIVSQNEDLHLNIMSRQQEMWLRKWFSCRDLPIKLKSRLN